MDFETSQTFQIFQTYEEFAKALAAEPVDTPEGAAARAAKENAELLLALRHHFVQWSNLDAERKGWFTMDDLVAGAAAADTAEGVYDYLSRPAAALHRVFGHIRANLRTRILRENRLLPLYKANEFNSRSIAWLSRRPGRSIRQKLAGTKSVMAVERRLTVDTTENRLFKALAKRFLALLLLKEEAVGAANLPAVESELIGMMTAFLHAEECAEIGTWTSPPPNNALLSDRYYHVAWTVWTGLKAMNGQLVADQENIGSRLQTAACLHLLARLGQRFGLPQQPIRYQLEQTGTGTGRLFVLRRPHFAAECQKQILLFATSAERRTIGLVLDGAAKAPKRLALSFAGGSAHVAVQLNNGSGKKKEESRSLELTADFAQELDALLEAFCPAPAKSAKQEKAQEQPRTVEGRQAVLDLYRPNPAVTCDGVRSGLRQRLLLQEVPAADGADGQEAQVCSLSRARAAFLDRSWPIDTAASLVAGADDRPENVLLLQQLFAEVRECVRTDALVLVCPDHCNDFELKPARQMARLQYFHVRTMPRSLDAVFRLMGQPEGQDLAEGDILVFLDTADTAEEGAAISVTAVELRYDSGLAKKVPATRGFVFEHHPSCCVPAPGLNDLDGLSEAEQQVLRELGADFLLGMADDLPLYGEDDAPVDLSALRAELRRKHDVTGPLCEVLMKSRLRRLLKGAARLHIVPLSENLAVSLADLGSAKGLKGIKVDTVNLKDRSEGEGIARFDAWTEQAGMAIWRDFLPDIAIKRLIGQFDLVKDSTFEYGFLKEKDITVPDARFILPKGQAEYHFQLEMSNVSEHTTYEAVVRHRAFPLKEDTPCLLRMKYTYDDDIPYSLDFIPIDRKHSGFTIAHVTWQRLKEFPAHGLRYMDFPPPTTWHALEHHIGKKTQREENLVAYLAKVLRQAVHEPQAYELLHLAKPVFSHKPFFYLEVCDPYGQQSVLQVRRDSLRGRKQKELFDDLDRYGIKAAGSSGRLYLTQPLGKKPYWRQELDLSGLEWQGWNRDMIFVDYCDKEGRTVTLKVRKGNFIFQKRIPEHPGRISCSINLDKGYVNDILDAEEPLFLLDELCFDREEAHRGNLDDVLRHKSGGLRYDLHNIYGGGLSLGGADCPERYQHILPMFAEVFTRYCAIMEEEEATHKKELTYHVMNLFCMLPGTSDHRFYRMLDDWVMTQLDKSGHMPFFWVGFAFGDCTTPDEQQLFAHLGLQDVPDFVGLLARAIWRYPDFIYNVPREVLLHYLSTAVAIITKSGASGRQSYSKGLQASAFEYVLALFRLRKLGDPELDRQLSLNNPELRKLCRYLEDRIRKHVLSGFYTRLRLAVTRSREYDRYADVPDFIYALLVCLTGTQDDSSIVITSIEDTEDTEDTGDAGDAADKGD